MKRVIPRIVSAVLTAGSATLSCGGDDSNSTSSATEQATTGGSTTSSSSEGSTTSDTSCETDCQSDTEKWEATCMAFAAKLEVCEPGADPLEEAAACMAEVTEGASVSSECSAAILAWYDCQAQAPCDDMRPVCTLESNQIVTLCPGLF